MDILEEFQKQYLLSKQRVLQEIDEWLLYVFYLENDNLQLRTTYTSPIRSKDNNPSFSIFQNTRSKREVEFLWKDGALGISGDIFDLLCRMFTLSEKQVLKKISHDFCILDDSKDIEVRKVVKRPEIKPETRIRIKAKKFTKEAWDFWNQYYVGEEILNWKQVKLVDFIWYSDSQEHPFKIPKDELVFAYPEYNKKYKTWHYQIYSPLSKDKQFKFRNDLRHNQLYGNNHLEYKSKTLVITKSNKDILVLKIFGIESIATRSETTPVKLKHIEYYKTKYENLVILYDNDIPGIEAASKYDLPSVIIPLESGCKDISDYIKKFGVEGTRELLKELEIL